MKCVALLGAFRASRRWGGTRRGRGGLWGRRTIAKMWFYGLGSLHAGFNEVYKQLLLLSILFGLEKDIVGECGASLKHFKGRN